MSVEIIEYSPKDMGEFVARYIPEAGVAERESIHAASTFSDPILGFFIGSEFAALVGFVPTTIIPAKAYVWMQDGPALAKNRFRSAKLILRMREVMLNQFPILFGQCVPGGKGVRWLTKLGAEFGETRNGLISFELRS